MTNYRSVGSGPLCPINNEHGRLYSQDDGSGRWFCPSSPHGGNGKFFTDAEAHGDYTVTEHEVAVIYEQAARDVISGRRTLDQAVAAVVAQTKRSSASVRESLALMIKTIEEHQGTGETMAEKKASTKAKKAASAPAPKDTARRQEHAGPEKFQAVLDELQMTNKQAAEATGAAGMGASATYIYILTHQGASQRLFDKFDAACHKWSDEHPFEEDGAVAATVDADPGDDDEGDAGDAAEPEPELVQA